MYLKTFLPILAFAFGPLVPIEAKAELEITVLSAQANDMGDYTVRFALHSNHANDICVLRARNSAEPPLLVKSYRKFLSGIEVPSVGDTFLNDTGIDEFFFGPEVHYSSQAVSEIEDQITFPVDDIGPPPDISDYRFQIILFVVPCSNDVRSSTPIEATSAFFQLVR